MSTNELGSSLDLALIPLTEFREKSAPDSIFVLQLRNVTYASNLTIYKLNVKDIIKSQKLKHFIMENIIKKFLISRPKRVMN